MATKVYAVGTDGVDYPEANGVAVKDGHLYVLTFAPNGEVLAIYTPGRWFSVDVVRNPRAGAS